MDERKNENPKMNLGSRNPTYAGNRAGDVERRHSQENTGAADAMHRDTRL